MATWREIIEDLPPDARPMGWFIALGYGFFLVRARDRLLGVLRMRVGQLD